MNMTPMIDCVFNLLIFFMLISDLNQKDLVELTLPVAYMAEEDKGQEEDDRVILNVDKYGQLMWKQKNVSLEELGTILQNARDRYEIKMKQQNKSGLEALPGGGMASKLYVLLRADKDTPWQHVQWLMTIMAEQKLYKLQFATKKFRDGNYKDDAEATALDARTQKEYLAGSKGGQ
ncbi:MAG: biopolymer transporter ExbD [Planctomycetes bacterium]|nr:biopolymer transporter ExbD [Planctomycetota bacterium]